MRLDNGKVGFHILMMIHGAELIKVDAVCQTGSDHGCKKRGIVSVRDAAVETELDNPGNSKGKFFLLLAQNLRTVGKTVVADVDAELTKRFRIVAAQQKVDCLIIRAFIVAQKILKNGKNLILKAAAGKLAAKIAELADAAFRICVHLHHRACNCCVDQCAGDVL